MQMTTDLCVVLLGAALSALPGAAKADILFDNGSFEQIGALHLDAWGGMYQSAGWMYLTDGVAWQASSSLSGTEYMNATDGLRFLRFAYDTPANVGRTAQYLGTMVAGQTYSFTADAFDIPSCPQYPDGLGPWAATAAFVGEGVRTPGTVYQSQTLSLAGMTTGAFSLSYTATTADAGNPLYIWLQAEPVANPLGDFTRGGIDNAVVRVNGSPVGSRVLDATWSNPLGGAVSEGSNWTPGAPTSSDGTAVRFTSAINSPKTVTMDAPLAVNLVVLDNANKYTIAGPETMTLAGVDPTIQVNSGSHEISAPVALAGSNGWARLPLTGDLTLSGVVSGSSILHKSGTGTLYLTNSANSFTGNVIADGVNASTNAAWGVYSAGRILDLRGAGIKVDSSYELAAFDTIYAGGSSTAHITTATGATLTFGGNVSFMGGVIVKDGQGTLDLTGTANDVYLVQNEGTLKARSLGLLDMAPGTTLEPDGTLTIAPTHLYVNDAFLKFDIGYISDRIVVPDLGAVGTTTFVFTQDGTLYNGQTIELIDHTNPMWTGSVANFTCAPLGSWQLALEDTGSAILLHVTYNGWPNYIPGDFNQDGQVGPEDFGILKDQFGTSNLPHGNHQSWTLGDANDDGQIGPEDFGLLKDSFGLSGGPSGPPLTNVPEPATIFVLFGATILSGLKRRAKA